MNFEDTGCTTLDMIGHATISADTTPKGDLTDVPAVSAMPDRAAEDGPSATAAAGNRTTPVPAMAAAADDGACSTAASCGWCC